MLNRREIFGGLVGLLGLGLIKPQESKAEEVKKLKVNSNNNQVCELFVYSFISKAIKDNSINTLDHNDFECYYDAPMHRQARYGWYGFFRGVTYKYASAIDIRIEMMPITEVGSFITDAHSLMEKTIKLVQSDPSSHQTILNRVRELQESYNEDNFV